MKKLLLFLCALLLVLAGCNNPAGGTPGNEPEEDVTYDTSREVLTALGLVLDESPAEDDQGNIVSGTDNPLGREITTCNPVYELAMVGADLSGFGPFSISEHDDVSGTGFDILTDFSASASWMSYPKISLSADTDGDGFDNVVTAVINGTNEEIYLQVQDIDGRFTRTSLGNFSFAGDFGDMYWLNDNFLMRDFTTGDFDGDEKPEFALSCHSGILVIEDDLTLKGSFAMEDLGGFGNPYVRVEAGDLNADGYDDLVVVNGSLKEENQNEPGSLYILSGGTGGLGVNSTDQDIADYCEYSGTLEGSRSGLTYSSAEVVIFDYDDDGYEELAIAGVQSDAGGSDDRVLWYCFYNIFLTLVDPYNEISGNFQAETPIDDYAFALINSNQGLHPRNVAVPRMVSGRFTPAGDMVCALDLMFSVNENSNSWEIFDQVLYTSSHSGVSDFHGMALDTAVAGDITGNGQDELIFATYSALPWHNSIGQGDVKLNVMNSIVIWGYDDTAGAYTTLETISCSSSNEFPTLALANVDNDTTIVKYLGHELYFSDPKILAILASAPYDAELGDHMDIGNSGTSYSISSSEGDSHGVSWGFSVGVCVGLDVEDPTGAFGAELEVAVDNSWDWSKAWASEFSTEITYNADAGYDQVIFAGIPYDTYVYEILSTDITDEAEYMTISIPRTPETNSVELSYYNSIVGDDAAVPEDLLVHTIGDPSSYYDSQDKSDLEDEAEGSEETWLFSTVTATVSQGSGTTEINTEQTNTTTSDFSYDLGIGASVKAKVGYVTAGYSMDVHVGYDYTYEVAKGVGAGGEVGSIEDTDIWEDNNFEWGLMMIPRSFADQAFSLVTYWVNLLN